MTHFAKVVEIPNSTPRIGRVTAVIVADENFFNSYRDSEPGEWIQTSYNTFANKHAFGGQPLRGNYAIVGGLYDYDRDVFYINPPYPSWQLNENTWIWEAPIPAPVHEGPCYWDESVKNWILGNKG